MARREDNLLADLAEMPWWVSIVVGALFYGGVRWGIPALAVDSQMGAVLAQAISPYAWISIIFVIPALVSVFRSAGKRRQLDRQSDIDSIRALPWKKFEELLAEAYRRQGFTVLENAGKGADGGIDVTIRRNGATYLVQCKQWRTYKVGVKVVREMLGLVAAHQTAGAIVVTSGVFTKEARDFAVGQPVELVDGGALARLIAGVQTRPSPTLSASPASAPSARRVCPQCGKDLVMRQAKRGPKAGSKFWGCSGYPNCRHTEEVAG